MSRSYSPGPGLCAMCANVRIVGNRRGSTFFLCGLAEVDRRFPKYPPLPVLRCPGFEAAKPPASDDGVREATD